MANLVDIYNKGNVDRTIKFIESEVAKACSRFLYQPITHGTLMVMQAQAMDIIDANRRYYDPLGIEIQNITVSFDDGTRPASEDS